jgi:hypothetical protein
VKKCRFKKMVKFYVKNSNVMLPEFLFSNNHVGLPLYTRIDEEQFQLLHTVAMEICDST